MSQDQIRAKIAQMTLEEKASLCSGADVWHLKSVERLGIRGKNGFPTAARLQHARRRATISASTAA